MGLLERQTREGSRYSRSRYVKRETFRLKSASTSKPGRKCLRMHWLAYRGLDVDYVHNVIDHAEVRHRQRSHERRLKTSGRLLKRGLKGTYISVEPFHLFRYSGRTGFPLQQPQDR